MVEIARARLFRFVVGLDVVIAIGQAQPAGGGETDHLLGIGKILVGAEAEKSRAGNQVQPRHERRQIGSALQGRDLAQARLQRARAGLFDGRLIHAGGEIVADLLLVGRAARRRLGILFEHSPQVLHVLAGKFAVDVPARLVGRNRIQFVPTAAGEAVEIHAGVSRAIEKLQLEARRVGQGSERPILRGEERRKEQAGNGQSAHIHKAERITGGTAGGGP